MRFLLPLLFFSLFLYGDKIPSTDAASPPQAVNSKTKLAAQDCLLSGPKFFADLLYLRAQNTGFIFCVKTFPPTGGIDASIQRIDYNWEPGLRVGVGYNTPRDGFDVEAVWTGYYNRSTASVSYPTADGNSGIIATFFGFGPYRFAAAEWNLHFNMIDFDMGKKVALSRAFSLRIFSGLRGGWIYQRFVSRSEEPQDVAGRAVVFSMHDRFNGIGPLGGLDGDYKLGKGFALNGSIAASILYGRIRVKDAGRQLINNVYVPNIKYIDGYFDLEPALRCALGFSWTRSFPKSQASIVLATGWEADYWWDQYHVFAFAPIGDIPSFVTKAVTMEGAYFRVTGNF